MRNMLLNCLAVILGFLLGTCIVSDLELCVKEAYGEWIGFFKDWRTAFRGLKILLLSQLPFDIHRYWT